MSGKKDSDDDIGRLIQEFHEERDTAALRSGTHENDILTGRRDRAWEESGWHLPEGMTLTEFFRRRREERRRPKRSGRRSGG